jgi:hypothetical protein
MPRETAMRHATPTRMPRRRRIIFSTDADTEL